METKPIRIDVDSVIRQRLPRHYRYIPKWLIRWIERTIHQDGLNKILSDMGNKKGVDAADIALDDLNIKYQAVGEENIPSEGRFIFASNHPLGGLDGMALISLIGHRYGGDNIKFIVNDLLMAVKPLDNVFLPINKHGHQSRQSAQEIERDIIPVYFDGQNSKKFYRMARWRERLGIKLNIEMVLLPGEMFKSSGSTYKVHFGKPVKWQSLDSRNARAEAARLRDMVYELKES